MIEVLISLVVISVLVGLGAVRYLEFNRRQTIEAAGSTVISALRDVQAKAQANVKPEICTANNWQLYAWQVNYWNLTTLCPDGPCLRSEAICYDPLDTDGDSDDYEESSDDPNTPHKFYQLPPNTQFSTDGSSRSELFFLPLSRGVEKDPDQLNAFDLPRFIVERTPRGSTNTNTLWTGVCVTSGGEIRNCGVVRGAPQPSPSWCNCL